MPLTSARRLLAGAMVAGAVVAGGAFPASAALKAATDVEIYLPDVMGPAGASGALVDPLVFAADDTTVYDATFTLKLTGDVAGLSFTTDEESGENCEIVSATEATCTDAILYASPFGESPYLNAVIKADGDAEIGATATLTATLTSEDTGEVTQTSTVTVAETVNLTAGPDTEITAKPGAAFGGPVAVSNTGDKTITGAAVIFDNDFGIEPAKQFSNCRYYEGVLRACVFEQSLEPGVSYAQTMPYRLRKDTYAPGRAAGGTGWMTAAEFADYEKYLDSIGIDFGSPGDGGEFTLEEANAQRRGTPQVDPFPEDNWSYFEVDVTGKNGTDLVAVGADLKGAAGDQVTAAIGVDNRGPATLYFGRSGTSAAATRVYVPAGVKVIKAPEDCVGTNDGEDWDGEYGRPGKSLYLCWSDYLFVAGESLRFEFGFEITDAASTPGKITVNEECECEGFFDDLNKANNVAVLSVNGITGGGVGGGDPDDPTLPVTGPAGVTIALSGLVVLGLGVAGIVLARRRRTTFVS